jgi:hypothetical protein
MNRLIVVRVFYLVVFIVLQTEDDCVMIEDHGDEEMMMGLLNVRGPTSASLHIQKLHLDFRLLFKYFIE